MNPVRLKLSRARGFDLQAASRAINGLPARSCARPGSLGNPFGWQTPQLDAHTGRFYAVENHREWLAAGKIPGGTPRAQIGPLRELREKVLAMLPEIRDHNLGCWCGLDQLCHVDTLLELANR